MIYHVSHVTRYTYREQVSLCHNLAHLTPRASPQQRCLESNLAIRPAPASVEARPDYFGNPATFFTIQEPHQQLVVTATHQLEVTPSAVPPPEDSPPWETVREQLRTDRSAEALDAYQYVFDSVHVRAAPEYAAYAEPSFPPEQPLLVGLLDLSRRIHREFGYDPRATTVATPLRTFFANRRGVCQDFAHLQIACLRSLGLAARYVSGYLCTRPPPGQQRLIGADASHAWLSAWCPGVGWVDVDPTNDQVPRDKHVLLAWGRDFADVSPIKGIILGGGQHQVSVAVDVAPMEGQN